MARKRGILRRIIASQSLDMSVVSSDSAVAQVKELWDAAAEARERAEYLQAWHDLELKGLKPDDSPIMPDRVPDELRRIKRNSPTPWGRMIVNETAQLLAVDDIRQSGSTESSPAYRVWQQNGLDAKQVPLIRGALIHGYAFNVVLPAEGRRDKKPTAIIRGKSALRMTAFFRDDFDEYPEFALEVQSLRNSDGTTEWLITFYDDERVHRMSAADGDGEKIAYIDSYPHGMGVCPVVRFAAMDLLGYSSGEIEPHIPLFRRIDQDTCDRLVVQRFLAYVTRTVAGLAKPTGPNAEAAALEMRAGDFLVSTDKDTKFGSLPGSPMDGHIRARDQDVKDLGATSQTPSYRLLGLGDNIGADAIKAANESQDRKVDELKRVYGEAHEATLRLAGHAMGDEAIADDFESNVHWVPRKSETLQSLTQGLATAATSLEIDPSLLWEYLPEWDRNKTEQAQELREEREAKALLEAAMIGADSGDNGGNAAGSGAPAGAGEPGGAAQPAAS